LVAATPWIAMIWSVALWAADSSEVGNAAAQVPDQGNPQQVKPGGEAPSATTDGTGQPNADQVNKDLELYWGVVEDCLFALFAIVLSATISLLMLRFAVTAQSSMLEPSFVDPSAFPSYAVTLYGGLFVVALVVVCLPLMIAWRRLKLTLVLDQTSPGPSQSALLAESA